MYHRIVTAVQGVSLTVPERAIVALLGTNGAGKTTTLRAISGFLGIDDARVTEGAIALRGERIENLPPHAVTARGIVLVPERNKVFQNLTVAENLIANVPRRGARHDARRLGALVYEQFPALAELRSREAGYLSGGERQMLAIGAAPDVRARSAAGRRAVARPRAAGRRGTRAAPAQVRDELGITILLVEQNAAVALDIADYALRARERPHRARRHARAAARAPGHPGVLSRRRRRHAAQLSRREAVPAQPAVVWLTLALRGHRACASAACMVLDGVSLAVERGELLALIGPNGAGKTSLLNCISGLYRPSAGAVRFGGRDLVGMRPHQIAALGVARTFQHGELFPHLTVVENLLVGRHARMRTGAARARRGSPPAVRREEVEHREAVERDSRFRGTRAASARAGVGACRSGAQKLVGFARALAMEPAVLLLDEPSAGLNRDEREDLARFILRIKHELALPMIWIEHDMQMVADLADRLHVLDYGRTLAAGTADAVLRDPRVVERVPRRRCCSAIAGELPPAAGRRKMPVSPPSAVLTSFRSLRGATPTCPP